MSLNERQLKFLEIFFSEEHFGDALAATKGAGYSENTPPSAVLRGLREEILERLDLYLVQNSPKALKKVLDVLDNPEAKGNKATMEAAAMILDRAGITKKERQEVTIKAPNGLFFIPKKED